MVWMLMNSELVR